MVDDVLPGVSGPESCKPIQTGKVSEAVRSARRRAAVHDVLDGLALVAVDAAFLFWPDARLPLTTRGVTVTLLIAVHVLFIASILLTRKWPLWRAKVVAGTWSRAEQTRFEATKRSAHPTSRR